MTYEVGIKTLADSAGRPSGSVVNNSKICKDVGYVTLCFEDWKDVK